MLPNLAALRIETEEAQTGVFTVLNDDKSSDEDETPLNQKLQKLIRLQMLKNEAAAEAARWEKREHDAKKAKQKEAKRLQRLREGADAEAARWADRVENAPLSERARSPAAPAAAEASSEDEERPLAARRAPPAAAEASSDDEEMPLAARGAARRAAIWEEKIARPNTVPLSTETNRLRLDNLGKDSLALILGAIGEKKVDRAEACMQAKNWCSVSKTHDTVCEENPEIWKEMTNRIFQPSDAQAVNKQSLIYQTFHDDKNPRKAFYAMCGATSLADAVAKKFEEFAIKKYDDWMWETWVESGGEYDTRSSTEKFPDLGRTEEWIKDAETTFGESPSKDLFIDTYSNQEDDKFSNLVNFIFGYTCQYLFEDGAIDDVPTDEADVGKDRSLEGRTIGEIGDLIGVYVVCLWIREIDIKNADYEDETSDDTQDVLVDEMRTESEALRKEAATSISRIIFANEDDEPTEEFLNNIVNGDEIYTFDDWWKSKRKDSD